jgi:hypothetical protein
MPNGRPLERQRGVLLERGDERLEEDEHPVVLPRWGRHLS